MFGSGFGVDYKNINVSQQKKCGVFEQADQRKKNRASLPSWLGRRGRELE